MHMHFLYWDGVICILGQGRYKAGATRVEITKAGAIYLYNITIVYQST